MMVKYFLKNRDEETFNELTESEKNCWAHTSNADLSSIKEISSLLKIDLDEISDSLDLMEIPRVEKIDNGAVIVYTRFPNIEDTGFYTSPLSIILAKDLFVTISPTECPFINEIIEAKSKKSPYDKTEFLVHILLKIIQRYTRVIKKIRTEVVFHEKNLTNVDEKDITELTQKEENLNQCLNALQPLRRVINDLLTGKFTTLDEDDKDHLEDLYLGSEQAEVLCDLSLRIISSLRNSVQVVITNEYNKTLKLLTALTIILNLPTTIASIYGMNVPLPFAKSDHAFAIVMSFIVVAFIGSLYFFQRRKWL